MTWIMIGLLVYLVSMQWVQMRRDRQWRAEVRERFRALARPHSQGSSR